MRRGRRRATAGALAVAFAACAAGGATATAVSALTVGLPAIEVKVPSTEVSLGGVHLGTPGATVTVPSVGVTTPSTPVSTPEAPVTTTTTPAGEQAAGSSGSGSSGSGSSTASGSGQGTTTAKGTEDSPSPSKSPSASPSTVTRARPSPATRASARPRATGPRAARPDAAHGVKAPSAGAPNAPAHPLGHGDPHRGRGVAERRSTGDPLAAIGGSLPLPLPVPDWSKPIILLLLVVALALAVRWWLTARRAKRLETEHETLVSDLHAMQAALVPELPRRVAGEGVSVAYRPADGVAAGGDFYDVFELGPGRIALVLGDVCGHGREALNRAALSRFTIRAYLQAGLEPRAVLALAGEALADPLSVHFATVLVGIYEPGEGRLTYASAGHPGPIVLGDDGPPPIEVCCSPPVGVGLPTGRRQTTIRLPLPGVACIFTDGLTEARTDHGLLGTERLAEILADLGPRPGANQLLERVTEQATATPDDMAACVLVSPATTAAGESLVESGSAVEPHPPAEADLPSQGRLRVEELEVDRQTLAGQELPRFLAACSVAGPEAQALLAQAEEVIATCQTAVLRLQLDAGGTRAAVLAPESVNASEHHGLSDSVSVRPPAGAPAHA